MNVIEWIDGGFLTEFSNEFNDGCAMCGYTKCEYVHVCLRGRWRLLKIYIEMLVLMNMFLMMSVWR